jgi:hypothetical protein
MAAYDNVALQGPPNPAAMINAGSGWAKQLYDMIGGLPQAYYQGQESQYQQRNRDLFPGGLPLNARGMPDLSATMQKVVQAGGAAAAEKLLPMLQRQPFLDRALQEDDGRPQNTGPGASVAAASPASLTPGASSRPQLSSTGMDSAGSETLQSLAAGIAGGRDIDIRPAVTSAAKMLRIDPNQPLSAAQQGRATRLLGGSLGTGGGDLPMGSPSRGGVSAKPQANPVSQPGFVEDENNTNHLPPSGVGGSSAISPRPTSASGSLAGTPARQPLQVTVGPGGQPSPTFNDRFDAAYGSRGGAANMVPSGQDPLAFAQMLKGRAEQLRRQANTYGMAGFPTKAKEDQAAAMDKQADAILEQLGKAGELTPEQKNVSSGATERAGQIAADTKYYDSLHRGLAGSAMIAAQQKQNIDMLRQIASSPSFTPGFGTDLFRSYQRALAQAGIRPENAAPRELFDQLAARVLADQFSGMKSMASETGEQGARVFRSMLDIEEKANITHEDSLAGIRAKLDLIDRTGDLMLRWADKADDYKLRHGRLDAGFDKELRAEISKARVPNAVPGGAVAPGRYKWSPEGGLQRVP